MSFTDINCFQWIKLNSYYNYIVFVWSQYDGANIEQRIIGHGWRHNQEAKLKIVRGAIS